MPIYEYRCRNCEKEFELIVRSASTPACPHCKSADLERRVSLPAVKSETTHKLAMAAAKRRDKKDASEKNRAQREYELKHND